LKHSSIQVIVDLANAVDQVAVILVAMSLVYATADTDSSQGCVFEDVAVA